MGLHGPLSCLVRESFTNYRTGSVVKNLAANAGDTSSVPGLGRSPGGRNDHPFQYICLEKTIDRRVWQAIVHGVAKSRTQLKTNTFTLIFLLTT